MIQPQRIGSATAGEILDVDITVDPGVYKNGFAVTVPNTGGEKGNLISDLGGMLCDGAKGGCAFKVASSTDSAIRAAYVAINDHGITRSEGFVGKTAEETILNLSKISKLGMEKADHTMLGIMIDKTLCGQGSSLRQQAINRRYRGERRLNGRL